MTRAIVFGATGYTGREVVRVLVARGLDAIAHVRPDSPELPAWDARFHALGAEVDVTPWSEGAMTQMLASSRPDVVFALLGTTRARARRAAREGHEVPSYESVDYGLTALLLRASMRSDVKPRFVYLSSLGVGPRTDNPYLAVRHRMEEELKTSGIAFTIARPSFISGTDRDESRPLERTASTVTDAALGFLAAFGIRKPRARYASMTGAELAEALVDAALDPSAEGQTLEADALRQRAMRPRTRGAVPTSG